MLITLPANDTGISVAELLPADIVSVSHLCIDIFSGTMLYVPLCEMLLQTV